ncbi:MAG TPA: ABC transporter substrate-binding protein [Candidatus Bathyarchaeia archaeon]|nr:ABC transporter substrate-binding protein [Candidatus Bathyarchaeia archaeon]
MLCRLDKALSLALAVSLVALMAPPARAASPTSTMEAFFEQTNVILRATDRSRGAEEARLAIRQLVSQVIDFREAAARALGPAWSSKPRETQDEFTELFASVLERGFIAAIASKANLSGGVKVRYVSESISGDQAVVSTTLQGRNGADLPVDYRMIRRGDDWKVQDVVIEDVSLIANYRAQFSRILRDHPYTGLIAKMKGDPAEPLADGSAGTPDLKPMSWPTWVIGHMHDERGVPETMPVREERD